MVKLITEPKIIDAAGSKPKRIEEYIGRVNTGNEELSIARMVSPAGWEEPAQTPEFDEYTVVLRGQLEVRTGGERLIVKAGQAIVASAGEKVQYATPGQDGAEYVAVCLPAFAPQTVHRDRS